MLNYRKMPNSMSGKILGLTMIKLLALIGILGILITVMLNNWPVISDKIFPPNHHNPPKACQSSQNDPAGCHI